MRTPLNRTLVHCIVIGLFSIPLTGCSAKIDKFSDIEYIIVNTSSWDIEMSGSMYDFKLKSGESYSFTHGSVGIIEKVESDITPVFSLGGRLFVSKTGEEDYTRTLSFTESLNGILNYQITKISTYHFKLTYYFTDEVIEAFRSVHLP